MMILNELRDSSGVFRRMAGHVYRESWAFYYFYFALRDKVIVEQL